MTRYLQHFLRQSHQFLGTVGIVRDPEGVPALRVKGINGRDAFCIGLSINGQTVDRLAGESWDDMLARVRRDPALRGDPENIATCVYR